MTTSELHEILDDENKKISLKEYQEILFQLRNDCYNEKDKTTHISNDYHFYHGETNALGIALDLSEHIEDKRIAELERALELACEYVGCQFGSSSTLRSKIDYFKVKAKKEIENEN